MNQRLRYLLIGKKCLKFSYLADSDSFRVDFPKATRTLLKIFMLKNFEDFDSRKEIPMSEWCQNKNVQRKKHSESNSW